MFIFLSYSNNFSHASQPNHDKKKKFKAFYLFLSEILFFLSSEWIKKAQEARMKILNHMSINRACVCVWAMTLLDLWKIQLQSEWIKGCDLAYVRWMTFNRDAWSCKQITVRWKGKRILLWSLTYFLQEFVRDDRVWEIRGRFLNGFCDWDNFRCDSFEEYF